MRISLVFALSLFSSSLAAQDGDPMANAAAKILGASETNTRIVDILQHLTDWIGPRLSGSPGAAEAVRWTAERMTADGLQNVRLQPVMVPHWIRGTETANLVFPASRRLLLTALGGSVGTPPEGITADVVEVKSFEEFDRLGERVRGKIVYYHNPMDPALPSFQAYGQAVGFRGRGAIEAARRGAVAALIRSLATESLGTPHTGAMSYAADVPKIPAAALSTEDADLLHRLLAAGETPRVHIELGCRQEPDVESANVIGELPGRERPEEIVVIGGHLDSWDLGAGAFDDGAGCAMAMEAARLLKELGLVPRRTIRVVLFMNEENGGRGGAAYGQMPPVELRNHVAAIESDSGADAPLGFTLSQGGRAAEMVTAWARHLAPIGATRVLTGGYGGADIAPLGTRGVLALGMTQDSTRYFDFHHSAADTFDKVDVRSLRKNLAAMAFMAYALAEFPERLSETPRTAQ